MGTVIHGILEYDEEKNRRNIEMRALPFSVARRIFADPNMVTKLDDRKDYGEPRIVSYGLVDGDRLRLCWTPRGNRIRVISLYRVHIKEWEKYYGKNDS